MQNVSGIWVREVVAASHEARIEARQLGPENNSTDVRLSSAHRAGSGVLTKRPHTIEPAPLAV